MVRGFVVSIERLGREFEDVLKGVDDDDNDDGGGNNDHRENDNDDKEREKNTVTILPIKPSPEPGNHEEGGQRDKVDETEYMFVGRSKEEVEKRLGEEVAGFGLVEEEEMERVRRNLGEL